MNVSYEGFLESHDKDRARRLLNGELIAETLLRYVTPKSAIDLGCGLGFFLAALKTRGVTVTGVEGQWVETAKPAIERDDYVLADLNHPFKRDGRFDLASSLEVAEHLKPARSEAFVAELCALSDVVLFSAGIPGQGGYGHINPRFQDEWAEMFAANGYKCYDPLRRKLAGHDQVYGWFAQNILLFIKDGHRVNRRLADHEIAPSAAAYVCKSRHVRLIRGLRRKVEDLTAEVKELKSSS